MYVAREVSFFLTLLCCLVTITVFVAHLNNGQDMASSAASSLFMVPTSATVPDERRNLQFEGLVDPAFQTRKKKKATKNTRMSRSQSLVKAVDTILLEADRYHLWWTGPPPDSDFFKPVEWAAQHNYNHNAIFTMAVLQGQDDSAPVSYPNDLKLFLGTARKYYQEDIVIALEADSVTKEAMAILAYYKAVVYLLPKDLCSKATRSIFCGSEDERVPASVFRYFFYEKWAAMYSETSLVMTTDFRDVFFQGNPFDYRLDEWFPEYQLAVFQESHPNMVLNRCKFNKVIMAECYGEESLRTYGNRIIISSGALMGTRDALLVWSHHMTLQLQDAPGRQVETRCTSGGIDHSFINWLIYGFKLRQVMRVRLFPQGEGAVNTLGGLKPDTVAANITGDIKGFWKVLDDNGRILNWNGEVSPVVHQLDHFQEELLTLADEMIALSSHATTVGAAGGGGGGGGGGGSSDSNVKADFKHSLVGRYAPAKKTGTLSAATAPVVDPSRNTVHVEIDGEGARLHPGEYVDRAWQAVAASQCLFDCKDSVDFHNYYD